MNDLRIKIRERRVHDHLWTFVNPFEEEAFKHFAGGSVAIVESNIPELVYVAGLHGWTVTKEGDDSYLDSPVALASPGWGEGSSKTNVSGHPLRSKNHEDKEERE